MYTVGLYNLAWTGRWKPSRLLLFSHCYCLHCFFPMRLQASCLIHLLCKSLPFTSQQHVNGAKLIAFQPCTHPLSFHAKVLCQRGIGSDPGQLYKPTYARDNDNDVLTWSVIVGYCFIFEHNQVMSNSCRWQKKQQQQNDRWTYFRRKEIQQ